MIASSEGINVNDVILLAIAILTITNTIIASRNHQKIKGIDEAVNKVGDGAPTLREAVEEVKEKITTPDPNAPPIGQTVVDIAHSLESSTARETDPKGH